jgi:hypothetical protein
MCKDSTVIPRPTRGIEVVVMERWAKPRWARAYCSLVKVMQKFFFSALTL